MLFVRLLLVHLAQLCIRTRVRHVIRSRYSRLFSRLLNILHPFRREFRQKRPRQAVELAVLGDAGLHDFRIIAGL